MQPAEVLASWLAWLTPLIIWAWLLSSLGGLGYALRLWLRSIKDVENQRRGRTTVALMYVANSNRLRVEVRVWMFAGFLAVGLCAVLLTSGVAGIMREIVRFLYVVLFLLINFAVTFNSYRDEKRDRILQALLR